MGKARFVTVTPLTTVAASVATDISELENASFMVGGTFVGTYSLQLSFDAGTTWVDHPDTIAVTVPKITPIGMRTNQVRVNVTGFTSGQLDFFVAGEDQDRLG